MLEKVANWNFDIFLFDRLTNGESAEASLILRFANGATCWIETGMEVTCPLLSPSGNSLITLTFHLLNQYGLVELFQLDRVKLWRFLVMVQEDYHCDNPYHNAVHAADVTQAMYCFMREPKVRPRKPLSPPQGGSGSVCHHRLTPFVLFSRSSPSR